MDRRTLIAGTLALLAAPLAADAQAPQRVFRIGVLSNSTPPPDVATYDPGLARELLARGWVEGQHYVREYRFANGVAARLATLAAELVALPVDVIQADSSLSALAAKAATATVPIVFQIGVESVYRGLVASIAHPGGNVTGYEWGAYQEKELQYLKEAVPPLSRVGVLGGCLSPMGHNLISADAARIVGVQVQCLEAKDSPGLARVLASTVSARIDGLVVVDRSWMTRADYQQIADFAKAHGLPTIGEVPFFTDAGVGGLLYYGPRRGQADAAGAALIDKILRGAKPADLPVEGPKYFTFVINLKTAKALGLTIPPSVLARADEVIQ